MAETTGIAWTDSTFNPWIGCTRVSAGCVNCYAETLARNRMGIEWGPAATRVRTRPAYWQNPKRWNKVAFLECKCGWRGTERQLIRGDLCPACESSNVTSARQRVFCASLADVFEDNPQLVAWRDELRDLIADTDKLDWLLLTKRPENVKRMWPSLPGNVWLGTTVEEAKVYEVRVKALLESEAAVHFLSCEPLLGHVSLDERFPIDWLIVGGESGPQARDMRDAWALDLFIQARRVSYAPAFFMKQFGTAAARRYGMKERAGADFAEFPLLKHREFPPLWFSTRRMKSNGTASAPSKEDRHGGTMHDGGAVWNSHTVMSNVDASIA